MNPLSDLICGNSCVLGPPGGMATNGPCQCLPSGHLTPALSRELRQKMLAWATRMRALAAENERLRGATEQAERATHHVREILATDLDDSTLADAHATCTVECPIKAAAVWLAGEHGCALCPGEGSEG